MTAAMPVISVLPDPAPPFGERVARRLTGVKGVINVIKVCPQTKPSPGKLRRGIEEALVRNAETDADAITVSVDGETAILRGSVHSWTERERAEMVARRTPGVPVAEHHITISS